MPASGTWVVVVLAAVVATGCGYDGDHVVVDVTPHTATVAPGATRTFSALVVGATDPTVTWSVQEAGGGTVTVRGVYTAPTVSGTYHVVATSDEAPLVSAEATVTVAAPN